MITQAYPLWLVRIELCMDNELRVRCSPIIGWREDNSSYSISWHSALTTFNRYDESDMRAVLTKQGTLGGSFPLGVSATAVTSRELSYRVLEAWLRNDIYGQVVDVDFEQIGTMLKIIEPFAELEPPLAPNNPPAQPPQPQRPQGVPTPPNRGPNGRGKK